jgi:hypothetical protein
VKPSNRKVKVGSVVQIKPDVGFYSHCFMTVEKRTESGVQGHIIVPHMPGRNMPAASCKAVWEDIEYIGEAIWSIET